MTKQTKTNAVLIAMVVQVIVCMGLVITNVSPEASAFAMIWMVICLPCQFGIILNLE